MNSFIHNLFCFSTAKELLNLKNLANMLVVEGLSFSKNDPYKKILITICIYTLMQMAKEELDILCECQSNAKATDE